MVCRPSVVVHTFELKYLLGQLANLNQILCVASLEWEKGCIRFLGRLDQNSGFHGNQKPPYIYNGGKCPIDSVFSFDGIFIKLADIKLAHA